ncbi:O-antigen ligase family protein [Paenisporosarcina sp.]|uniref:O-antigen ligase family protein n=1 Tax=Paenisporosarcina sp. TaxID=1932001 RepID=UPI003C706C83
MIEHVPKWFSYLLFFMMLTSSFVLIEPSPYDFLMLLVIGGSLLLFLTSFTRDVFIPLIVMLLFLVFQLTSLLAARELQVGVAYLAITIYLMFSWFSIVGIGQKLKTSLLQVIMSGYLITAVLSAVIGVLAYFRLLPYDDLLLMFGRAKAFFKDPNVFGPFLIMPTLYAISLFEKEHSSRIKKTLYALTFLLLLTAIFVCFSRAAWGNWVISFLVYLTLAKKELLQERIKTFISLGILCIPVLIWLANSPFVKSLFQSRLSLQRYDDSRFATQKEAILTGFRNPFGIGPGQSEYTFQIAPHSLYARILTENGILSVFLFIFLLFISLHKAYQSYKRSSNETAVYFLIIFASLIGLVFNSAFIDTLHWRHFWLILALAWCAPKIRGDDG